MSTFAPHPTEFDRRWMKVQGQVMAPKAAYRSVMAFPMPREEPVIRTTLPLRLAPGWILRGIACVG